MPAVLSKFLHLRRGSAALSATGMPGDALDRKALQISA
jgi:hypothetical protein